jgi:hypothetical protein
MILLRILEAPDSNIGLIILTEIVVILLGKCRQMSG